MIHLKDATGNFCLHHVSVMGLCVVIPLYLILNILFFPASAYAQSEEEMRILRMFYKEDELFITPTRAPKPITQIAENITVITSEEIEEMNAHTVAEVLERVTGLFVDFQGRDFGSTALLSIQGSSERHVLVLLDGIPWNFLSGGNAEINSIPVRIIERIEVIKGPASSAWGSSLGGVINIITKGSGDTGRPTGSISASYGKGNTQDYTVELSGMAGTVGYYLSAGRQDSDGLRTGRYFENNSFFSKLNIPISADLKLGLTMGYSEPYMGFGDFPSSDITSSGITRAFFATAALDAVLTRELSLNVSLYTFKQKFVQRNDVLGMGFLGSAGDMFLDADYDEKTIGGSSSLVWTHGRHTAVLGLDISHGSLDQSIDAGEFLQSIGAPESSRADPDIDRWAVFANDTITIGRLSITPGIRYDRNSITGSFISPSLGATYRLGEKTILRTSVARGFTIPPLSHTSGGALFLDPNPSLNEERVWSYQAGVESGVTDYLGVKATGFYHDLKDAIVREFYAAGPPSFNDLMLNKGGIRRQGLEIDAKTVPFHNISLKAGFAYVHIKTSSSADTRDLYAYNLSIKYDDRKSFMAELFGHYTWWDLDASAMAEYNSFIWDLNLRKRIYSTAGTNTWIFLTAHNIFNSSYYTFVDMKNPRRWVEAGLRLRF